MTDSADNHPSRPSGSVVDAGPLPSFASEEELREFFDTHDMAPYFEQMEDVTNNPPAELAIGPGRAGSTARRRPPPDQMETIAFDIPAELAEVVRAMAYTRRLTYQELLRSWIAERVAEERRRYAVPVSDAE